MENQTFSHKSELNPTPCLDLGENECSNLDKSASKEGWPRHRENGAKPPLMERTGWSLTSNVWEGMVTTWLVSDHHVCGVKVA